MKDKAILLRGKPSVTTQPLKVRRKPKGIASGFFYHMSASGPEVDFGRLRELRSQSADPEVMGKAIANGSTVGSGHFVANVGISAALTLTFQGDDYLLVVGHRREDFGDAPLKLPSGYNPASLWREPHKGMLTEVAEEILPVDRDGRLIRFVHGLQPLERPFTEHFEDSHSLIALHDPSVTPVKYMVPGLREALRRGDAAVVGLGPQMYFHAPTNSGQLLFPFHLDATTHGSGFEDVGVSLHHSEDGRMDTIDGSGKELGTTFHEHGIYMIQITGGELTDVVGQLVDGSFRQIDSSGIVLSEAFSPMDECGIVRDNNITLDAYLAANRD